MVNAGIHAVHKDELLAELSVYQFRYVIQKTVVIRRCRAGNKWQVKETIEKGAAAIVAFWGFH